MIEGHCIILGFVIWAGGVYMGVKSIGGVTSHLLIFMGSVLMAFGIVEAFPQLYSPLHGQSEVCESYCTSNGMDFMDTERGDGGTFCKCLKGTEERTYRMKYEDKPEWRVGE